MTSGDTEALLHSQLNERVFRPSSSEASVYWNDLVGEVSGVVSIRALQQVDFPFYDVPNALGRFLGGDYCSNLTFYYCSRGLDPHSITGFDFLHLFTSLGEGCTCLHKISRKLKFPAGIS